MPPVDHRCFAELYFVPVLETKGCAPHSALHWHGAGLRAVPAAGDHAWSQGNREDPWKAAQQVVGNTDPVFC